MGGPVAELRQGSVTFSGASTANSNNNTQNPNSTAASPGCPKACSAPRSLPSGAVRRLRRRRALGWRIFLLDYPDVLNHPVLGSPASSVTTQASFGQTSTLAYGNAKRILQFAVKLQF
jgi:hypothetical protein